jgi:hypothetical protein
VTYECTIDLEKALDWQRSKAPKLKALIQKKQAWYEENHCKFWNDWKTDVFNLDTANEFGLSVWSVILDEPLFGVIKQSPPGYPAWGFGSSNLNFGRGNFGTNADTGYNFTVEQKRIILKLKAFLVMSFNGSIVNTNMALDRIFGECQIYALDGLDMTWTYTVRNTDIIGFIREIKQRDLLPRPAAVKIAVVLNANVRRFGFGSNNYNFGNGNFITGVI